MGNTGFKKFSQLEQYYLDDNTPTGITKANNIDDPDYIAPIYDPSTCIPENRYYSELRTAFAIKNNCGPGYVGSSVEMKAMPAQFVSTISLDDANDKADVWLAENKQAFANLTGTCTVSTFYAITGCYWLQSDDDYEDQVCAVTGTATYYNTTGSNGWEIGDTVYEYVEGQYLPLTRDWDINTAIGYKKGNVRSWVAIEGYESVVLNSGTCIIRQDVIVYIENPRISGFNCIVDLVATRNIASDINIYLDIIGKQTGAVAHTSLTFYKRNGSSQYNNYIFNIEEDGQFYEDEPVYAVVVDWSPRYDDLYNYDVG